MLPQSQYLSLEEIKHLVEQNGFDKLLTTHLSQLTSDQRSELIDIAFERQYWEIVALLQTIGNDFIYREYNVDYENINNTLTDLEGLRDILPVKDVSSGHLLFKQRKKDNIFYMENKTPKPSPYFVPLIGFQNQIKVEHEYSLLFPPAKCTLMRKRNMHTTDEMAIMEWILQMCKAVQYLHQQGFVHANLKPSYFLCYDTDNGEVIRLFGTWMSIEMDGEENDPYGTIGFMSPEVHNRLDKGIIYRETVDVFSLGVTIINLFYGKQIHYDYQKPHYFYYEALKILQHVSALSIIRRPRIPRKLFTQVSNLILSMTKEKPEERPKLEQVIDCVQKILSQIKSEPKSCSTIGFYDCTFEFQNSDSAFEKGVVNYLQGHFRSSIYYFSSLLETHKSTGIQMLLANSFLNIGNFSQYFNQIEGILEKDQYCKSAYIHKILYFVSCGKLKEAQEVGVLNMVKN